MLVGSSFLQEYLGLGQYLGLGLEMDLHKKLLMEDHLVSILKKIFKNKKPGWVKISEPTVSGLMG